MTGTTGPGPFASAAGGSGDFPLHLYWALFLDGHCKFCYFWISGEESIAAGRELVLLSANLAHPVADC